MTAIALIAIVTATLIGGGVVLVLTPATGKDRT
jgi:hypothetical protein